MTHNILDIATYFEKKVTKFMTTYRIFESLFGIS